MCVCACACVCVCVRVCVCLVCVHACVLLWMERLQDTLLFFTKTTTDTYTERIYAYTHDLSVFIYLCLFTNLFLILLLFYLSFIFVLAYLLNIYLKH